MKVFLNILIIILFANFSGCRKKEVTQVSNLSLNSNEALTSDTNHKCREKLSDPLYIDYNEIIVNNSDKRFVNTINKDLPLVVAEQMPEFSGGEAAMYKFISKNLKVPELFKEAGVQGKVTIRFVVRKNGKSNY